MQVVNAPIHGIIGLDVAGLSTSQMLAIVIVASFLAPSQC